MSRAGTSERSSRGGIETTVYYKSDGTQTKTHRVRYADAAGRKRSATFDRVQDARDFKAQIRLQRRGGQLDDLDRGRETLRVFVESTWWPQRAGDLAVTTQRVYQRMLNNEILPRIGDMEVREIRPKTISVFKADVSAALHARLGPGRGGPTVRKAMSVLQSVLTDAVRWQLVDYNAVQPIKKPAAGASLRAVHPPTAAQLEVMRLLAGGAWSRTLMSVMGYAGLRPQEALALQWRHVRERTILVEQRISAGRLIGGQKSKGKPPRTIEIIAPLRGDLDAWRDANGTPPGRAFVFPQASGAHMTEGGYRRWRAKTFRRARTRAQLDAELFRPYDLRHLWASLRLAEQRLSLQEIAQEMGHTVEVLAKTYSHIIADLAGAGPVDLVEHITAARTAAIPLASDVLAREAKQKAAKAKEKSS
ncbi:phage integrase [Patulibacter medicamentivorans]|uniref:Phage integrase n=1 Tax=Patulibacter medicamentivorans TaxID=1097667 RepID=H0EAB0_9ACTN|nr:tyrosine-type recombinase/integrase [Patulibacter medicamentivorans]EHN09450.1 phage integrase [Patulibacter medicamentivorans]